MKDDSILIYGANGYTGRLIARHAAAEGLKPILAGRNRQPIEELANELSLPFFILDLDDETALISLLTRVNVVIHAAGPFRYTARQMVEACLKTQTHYLDINGDIQVFEFLKNYHSKAAAAGIMIMPGVGFDVVPTDCLALKLKNLLPGAQKLQLAFTTLGGGLSHGTAITMADKIGEGGAIRKDGIIQKVPLGEKSMEIDFFQGGGKPSVTRFVMSIPWGDVSTAYHTTGIPNIETFTGIAKKTFLILKAQVIFNWLLRTKFVRDKIKQKINSLPAGPDEQQRAGAKAMVWGKATDAKGNAITAKLCGPEGYSITMYASVIITKKILSGHFKAGNQTPAGCYGENLVAEIPGVEMA